MTGKDTGEDLFNRYAPRVLQVSGWEVQDPEVRQAWEELADRVNRLKDPRHELWRELAEQVAPGVLPDNDEEEEQE